MKKYVLLALAALVLGAVLFFYVSFNGNFISKMIAKHKVEQYVEQTYKEQNKQLIDSYYNFKDGQYTFNYAIYNNAIRSNYYFSIGGPFWPSGRIFSYLDSDSSDLSLTAAFNADGRRWVEQQMKEQNIAFDRVEYSVDIPRGYFEEDAQWQPDLEAMLLPSIMVDMKDEQQTDEQFIEQVEQIQQLLKDSHVTYVNCYISMTREFDNSDGSKEGYAETYYEGIYSTMITPETDVVQLK